MKSLTELWCVAAEELAAWCGISAARDLETVRARVEHEGESFLTITLPTVGAALERGLADGKLAPNDLTSFKRSRGLPAFLSGFLELVFDRHTAILLDNPSVDAIFAVRQLSSLFKKLEGDCTAKRNKAALDAFIHCEQELKEIDRRLTPAELDEPALLFARLYGDEMSEINREVDELSLTPKHGPGATADRKKGNGKYRQTEWTERLEPVFPYLDYVLPNVRYHDQLRHVKFLGPGAERPVKVTLVPKTRKTPRVIAIEPTAMQYCQQALMQSLVPKLESNQFQLVGFGDQVPNRALAREGSLTGRLATLDLSEASDRVLNSLVVRFLRPWPSLLEAVQATRTRVAILPDGRRVRLSKFASMGSALCFPMEALVFSTLVLYGVQLAAGRRLTRSELLDLVGSVRVYGDDIIVPVRYAEGVVSVLETFGLKVNRDKSFWTGEFRESCGGDFFRGEDVTPIRVKKYAPASRSDVESAKHWVEFSNNLHKRGLWKTAQFARSVVEGALHHKLPVVGWSSPALGVHSFTGYQAGEKVCTRLQRPLVRAFAIDAVTPVSRLDGIWALRKTLSGRFEDPSYRDHLERTGRPVASRMKLRWMPVA